MEIAHIRETLSVEIYDPERLDDIPEHEAIKFANAHLKATRPAAELRRWKFSHIIWHNHDRMTVAYEA